MRIIDISMEVDENIPVYRNKAEKKPVITVVRDHSTGSAHESVIKMDLHTGTHIDAPLHMIEGGSTFESIDIRRLYTWCRVYDFTHAREKITAYDLEKRISVQALSFC